MAAIADLDDLVNRMTGGSSGTPENLFWWKSRWRAGVAASWTTQGMISLWHHDGYPQGAAAVSATVEIPSSSTVGALPFTNASGGREKWIVQSTFVQPMITSADSGNVLVYDRLSQILLDNQVATAQTVGGSITRHTAGAGNIIFYESLGDCGVGLRTITIDYTNQAGTAGRTALTWLGEPQPFTNTNNFHIVGLQAGDTGVRSIQDVTVSAAATTADDFVIGIGHPLTSSTMGGSRWPTGQGMSTASCGNLPQLEDDTCIALAVSGSQAAGTRTGVFVTVEA